MRKTFKGYFTKIVVQGPTLRPVEPEDEQLQVNIATLHGGSRMSHTFVARLHQVQHE